MMDPTSPITPATAAPRVPKVENRSAKSSAKTAHDFEAVFLGQMAQMMMNTVQQDEQFSGGHGEEMFRGVLAEKLGSVMANRGGLGIAPLVMQQILKLQGGNDGK
jgi:Rod binding domain-containing protein